MTGSATDPVISVLKISAILIAALTFIFVLVNWDVTYKDAQIRLTGGNDNALLNLHSEVALANRDKLLHSELALANRDKLLYSETVLANIDTLFSHSEAALANRDKLLHSEAALANIDKLLHSESALANRDNLLHSETALANRDKLLHSEAALANIDKLLHSESALANRDNLLHSETALANRDKILHSETALANRDKLLHSETALANRDKLLHSEVALANIDTLLHSETTLANINKLLQSEAALANKDKLLHSESALSNVSEAVQTNRDTDLHSKTVLANISEAALTNRDKLLHSETALANISDAALTNRDKLIHSDSALANISVAALTNRDELLHSETALANISDAALTNRDKLLHSETALANISDATQDKHLNTKAALTNRDKLHLVVLFYNILDDDWVSKNFPPEFNSTQLEDRLSEIGECLRQNLDHHMVATVHFLYHDVLQLRRFFHGLNLTHQEKLFVHETNATTLTVGDYMRFASKNLQGRVAVVLNSDCFLGDGFDIIDIPYLRNKHVVYALTRHWAKCPGPRTEGGSCAEGEGYHGSHDAYIFNLRERLPEEFLEEVNIVPHFWNIEARLIGAFHETLHQTVLNPCKILKVMHLHCSAVRPQREKLTHGRHYKLAGFSGLYMEKNVKQRKLKKHLGWMVY